MSVELNVTLAPYNVIPNALIDQSDLIITALGALGTSGFGHSAYFPTGVYYISKQLLSLVEATCRIMLRGDGFGKTIFRIFPDVYYEDDALDPWSNSDWVVNDDEPSESGGDTLHIYSTGSAAHVVSTAALSFTCAKSSELVFKRKLPTGMDGGFDNSTSEFVVYDGSTPILSETTSGGNWTERTLSLDPGTHSIRFELKDSNSAHSGKPAAVIEYIRITNAMDDSASYTEQTIFEITGSGTVGDVTTAPYFSVRDITCDGSLQSYAYDAEHPELQGTPVPGSMRPVRWFLFDRASQINFDHVVIDKTYGTAVQGLHWQDSVFNDVSITNCGIASDTPGEERPALEIGRKYSDGTRKDASNNLKFIGCRFEGNAYISCRLRDYSRLIYFIGCKWHGKQYEDDAGPAIDFPQVDIHDYCYGISFTGCRFTAWKQTFIKASKSSIMVTTSALSGAGNGATSPSYAIDLEDCVGCAITGNNFAVSAVFPDTNKTEDGNKDGQVRITRGRNNVMSCNGIYPTPLIVIDEFNQGTSSSATIGDLRWTANNFSGGSVTGPTDSDGHPGIFTIECDNSVNVSGFDLASFYGKLVDPSQYFDVIFILKFNSSYTNVGYVFGLTDAAASSFTPTNGIYIKKTDTGSNWNAQCRASGTSSSATAGTIDNDWHSFRIWRKDSSTIGFSIDSSEVTVNSNVPTVLLNPFLAFNNTDTVSGKNLLLDYFDLKIGLAL